MTAAGLFMVFSFPPTFKTNVLVYFSRADGVADSAAEFRRFWWLAVRCFTEKGENKPGQFIFNSDMN